MSLLAEPFAYDFMLRAMLAAGLTGCICGLLSVFVVLKGWSMIGDALAHAVVPGVAVAYALGLPFALGAFVSGLLAAGGIALIRRVPGLKQDVAIGLVFTTFFAAGLALISVNPTAVDLQAVILGDILAVSDADFLQIGLIGGAVMLVMLILWRDFAALFFDEAHARSIGLPVRFLGILFFALLAGAIVAALQSVGAVLVIAMLIAPGATALLISDRIGRVLLLAAGLGAFSAAAGAYLAFFLDGATGGLIVCLQVLIFLAAYLFAPKHGLVPRRATRREMEA
jgi:manganese/iron transport system permease protein